MYMYKRISTSCSCHSNSSVVYSFHMPGSLWASTGGDVENVLPRTSIDNVSAAIETRAVSNWIGCTPPGAGCVPAGPGLVWTRWLVVAPMATNVTTTAATNA